MSVQLTSASRIPVQSFRLVRTRSAVAARSAETMGPPFAVVPAAAPPPGTLPDPATGELTYTATWSGAFDPVVGRMARPGRCRAGGWRAARGHPRPPLSSIRRRRRRGHSIWTTGPGSAGRRRVRGAGHDGVVIRSSTSAPVRVVALSGSHRIGGDAAGAFITPIALESVLEDAAKARPPARRPVPVLVRGARAAGRTPLTVWFTRPVAADPAAVTIRLVDPLGRVTEQTLHPVPGWVPPAPPTLELVDVFTLLGRGTVVTVRSDAHLDAAPPYVLEVVARRLRQAADPIPVPPRRGLPVVTQSFPLDTVPGHAGPFPAVGVIQAVRTTGGAPFEYQILIRMEPPFAARVSMVAPDGARSSVDVPVA